MLTYAFQNFPRLQVLNVCTVWPLAAYIGKDLLDTFASFRE